MHFPTTWTRSGASPITAVIEVRRNRTVQARLIATSESEQRQVAEDFSSAVHLTVRELRRRLLARASEACVEDLPLP